MTERKRNKILLIPILTLTVVLSSACSSGAAVQETSQNAEETDSAGKENQNLQNAENEQKGLSSEDSPAEQAEAEGDEAEFEPFIRIDRDDPNAWKEDLDNVRFEKKGLYKFGETKAKIRSM